MLGRSIPTRKALVHSNSISEVKDMNSNIFQALNGMYLFLKKKTLNLVCELNFINFQERKIA